MTRWVADIYGLSREEILSAVASAHATRNWALTGKRGEIADALYIWCDNNVGIYYPHLTLREVIEEFDELSIEDKIEER